MPDLLKPICFNKKLLFISLCIVFGSCFKITEKIKHHNNQSGEYSFTIDFSQSWLKTKSAILLKEVEGVKIPSEEEISNKINFLKQEAAKIDGITKVSTTTDFTNYVATISLEYDSAEALNKVLNLLSSKKNQVFCKASSGVFERFASYVLPENILKNPKRKSDLEEAIITTIYTFDKEILQVSNPSSKVAKNKKTVFLQQNIYNAIKKPALMNNRIQLK